MEIKEKVEKFIAEAGLADARVERPRDLARGDYACHARDKAEDLAVKINKQKPAWLDRAEAVGGFVNFHLAPRFFAEELGRVLEQKENYGRGESLQGRKIMVEYTDPNPFKEFHIGHLMSNTVGEAVSRLVESQGAAVRRACYQGDVGLHVARAVWGLRKINPSKLDAKILGQAYALGATGGDEAEIRELNKKIYDRSDPEVNKVYDEGRKVSLDYFEAIYQKLGTKFDFKFFESETGVFGKKVVEGGLQKGIFEKSDGAVVFRGDEKEGLHTRVFINSEGLPTYEAKELGLAKIKFDAYPYDQSVVVTGNEINAYFQVLLQAMSLVFPELAAKTKHLSHGMLRLPTGKMSSRTGDVITAESLFAEIKNKLPEQTEEVKETIAVAALKYSILRQAPGRDIVFDFEKSISFEGDSGPYLQYTVVRAKSVLEKADYQGSTSLKIGKGGVVSLVEKLLIHFPEVAARAAAEYAPQHLVTYLTELASAFNSYYAKNKIIGSEEEVYRLGLTAATAQVLRNGLGLLGIATPEKM